jgi:putative endonuclease
VFFTCILRCADDALYVGHASDLDSRIQRHNEGRGPEFTRHRIPVRLVYSEEHASQEDAVTRERQLKGWTRRKKEALISGDLHLLKRL